MVDGKIAGVKKQYVYIGGGLVIVVVGVVYIRGKKSANAAASTGNVTDPAGNVCSALDPNSGYCPGTPQDLAFQQSGQYSLAGGNSASYVGGQIIGYDQYGNPIYSSGPSSPGPGSYTSNAQWAQAAQLYLTQQEPNADPAVIAAALGQYIDGKPATEAQISIINQAITFEGIPPVGGPNGDPPGIITAGGGTPPPKTGNVKIPNVVGLNYGEGYNHLREAGFAVKPDSGINSAYIIQTESPKAGTSVKAGTQVTVTVRAPSKPPVRRPGK